METIGGKLVLKKELLINLSYNCPEMEEKNLYTGKIQYENFVVTTAGVTKRV